MFTVECRNAMLDAIHFDAIQLHSGPPGKDGTDNPIPDTRVWANFSTANNGERVLLANVDFTGLPALQPISHISIWADGAFQTAQELTGDRAANAGGEYTVKAISTKIGIQ